MALEVALELVLVSVLELAFELALELALCVGAVKMPFISSSFIVVSIFDKLWMNSIPLPMGIFFTSNALVFNMVKGLLVMNFVVSSRFCES